MVQEIETEVLADFNGDVATDFAIEVTPTPASPVIQASEGWVYYRREA